MFVIKPRTKTDSFTLVGLDPSLACNPRPMLIINDQNDHVRPFCVYVSRDRKSVV